MTTPPLPPGAEHATEHDDELGTRVVFSPDYCPGRPGVRASAVQTNSGVIVDDPAEEAPAVHVAVPDSGQLTCQEARALAAALQQAAGQAEAWAVEAAKQRHPSIVGRRAEGVR